MNDGFERRDFIHGVGLLAGAVAATTLIERPALAQTVPPTGAKPMTYDIKPLSLDPKSIKGISEKVLVSHYQNNYIGAVKRLNAIGSQLAELDFAKAPNFVINGLKREQLIAMNSMILHEVYFDSLGGGVAPRAPSSTRLHATSAASIAGGPNVPPRAKRWADRDGSSSPIRRGTNG
jgi:superoxide dismutase, Fe-Mn family